MVLASLVEGLVTWAEEVVIPIIQGFGALLFSLVPCAQEFIWPVVLFF